jgi:hypothetical protein
MPSTDEGKLQMIKEVEYMARTLNGLLGVQPWNFTATKVLEQELDVSRAPPYPTSIRNVASKETPYAPEGENSGGTLTGDMADTSTTQDNALVDCAADTSNSQDDTSEQTSGAPQESDTLIISTDNLTAVEGSTIKEGIEIEGPTTDKVTPSQDDCGGGESADTPIG